MVDTRRRNRNPFNDDNGYGDVPPRGAVGFRGRGPKGYKRSDERIHEDVCERLMEDPFIDASNIEVVVKDGEVTLNGTVSSRGLKRRAEDLAELSSGVAHVQNNLRAEGA